MERQLFIIAPDPALLKFFVRNWSGKRTHFGLFPGAICTHGCSRFIIAQPLDESPMAYASVRTLTNNFGPAPYLLLAPSVSLAHQFYPGDIAVVSHAIHFPYPAEFTSTSPPPPIQVAAAHLLPVPLNEILLRYLPQPAILAATAGHSTIPTPIPALWRRCRQRYHVDLLTRSPFGFLDCLRDDNKIGYCLAYITQSLHDNSAAEYRKHRLRTFAAIAATAEELLS